MVMIYSASLIPKVYAIVAHVATPAAAEITADALELAANTWAEDAPAAAIATLAATALAAKVEALAEPEAEDIVAE